MKRFERSGRGQEPSRGHKFSILENVVLHRDFTSAMRLHFRSDLVGVALVGATPLHLLSQTALPLKSPTGAFIAPLRFANAVPPQTLLKMCIRDRGTYLFTYPTTGYFDAFFYALMYAAGGPDFFNKATHYEEGIWDTPEAKTCFDIVAKLASYTNPITPAQANDQDFTQNQQLVLDNKALFMPNGTWIVGEMAEAPRADGFEWGMTALPAVKAGGDSYSYTWFEQAWIPAGAEHLDAAKQFVAYLYSDEACKLFAESGAIQPVLGIADSLGGDNKMFYSIYDNGAKAAMGNFASFTAIPGVEVRTVFFDPVNSLVSGSMTEQQWIDGIKSASDQMRANIIE